MLRFQANSRTEIIDNPLLAGQCAVQEVTTINLYTGLVGVNIQNDACSGRFECGTYFIYVSLSIQHPVVVDAMAVGCLKSMGVPSTLAISPVVMKVLSTGV